MKDSIDIRNIKDLVRRKYDKSHPLYIVLQNENDFIPLDEAKVKMLMWVDLLYIENDN